MWEKEKRQRERGSDGERERAAPLLTGAIVSNPYEFPSFKVQTPQVFNRCSVSLSLSFFALSLPSKLQVKCVIYVKIVECATVSKS